MAESALCYTREKDVFFLFLEGFKRPVRPPLWRNRLALALSVSVIREKDVFFSVRA